MVVGEGRGRGERKLESHMEGERGEKAGVAYGGGEGRESWSRIWSKTSTFALLQVSVVGEGQTYWSILQVQLESEDTSA